jgi:predicted ABC-type ATPase
MKPVLLIIAGPNGSGKTTVTVRLREERWSEDVEYLNPDEIARDRFGDWNSEKAILAAAQWSDERREELLRRRDGIAFETVFSSQAKVDFLARAKTAGYFARVFFISTSDPRINASRVANRVILGGHTVPIEKIVNRYERSMANLSAAIRLADRVYIYDNSIENVEARLCARTADGALKKVYGPLPGWVEEALIPLKQAPDFVDLRVV